MNTLTKNKASERILSQKPTLHSFPQLREKANPLL